jgi:hypothetical protein
MIYIKDALLYRPSIDKDQIADKVSLKTREKSLDSLKQQTGDSDHQVESKSHKRATRRKRSRNKNKELESVNCKPVNVDNPIFNLNNQDFPDLNGKSQTANNSSIEDNDMKNSLFSDAYSSGKYT